MYRLLRWVLISSTELENTEHRSQAVILKAGKGVCMQFKKVMFRIFITTKSQLSRVILAGGLKTNFRLIPGGGGG